MAGDLLRHDDNLFEGLSLRGMEFILPNISDSSLLEEFVVNPGVSDQIELEPYPTAILDDSCVFGVMSKPLIPLVESVEAFSLGLVDTPIGHSSVIPSVGVLMNNQENHGLQCVKVKNAECHWVSSGSFYDQTVQCDANASTEELQNSSNSRQPLVNPQLLAEVVEKLRNWSAK